MDRGAWWATVQKIAHIDKKWLLRPEGIVGNRNWLLLKGTGFLLGDDDNVLILVVVITSQQNIIQANCLL